MKIFLIILILFNTVHAFKSEEEVHIGVHTFNLVKEDYNEYGDKGMTMVLYALDGHKNRSKKLTFLLRNESGQCSDKDIENGTYVIKKDSIIFYTHWKRSRSTDNVPSGDRMQVFKVDENGSFSMSDSKIYVERTRQNADADEGMQYLHKEAKTAEQKKLLAEYIASVEHIFKAKFVMGEEADNLALEVHKALENKQKQRWK